MLKHSDSPQRLNYTAFAQRLIADLVEHIPEFAGIDPERVGVLAAARCTNHATGNLAMCYGLRREVKPTFSIWSHPGTRRVFAVSEWFRHVAPRVVLRGTEMSYLILLRLPRLLRENPLEILIHELYHIHPSFDRTMRPERHGAAYDTAVRRMMRHYLAKRPGRLAEIAQMRLPQLQREYGQVVAEGVPASFKTPLIEVVEPTEEYEEGVVRLYPGHTLQSRHRVIATPVTAEHHPRRIDEKDLVLRHYSSRGAVAIPRGLARYGRGASGLGLG